MKIVLAPDGPLDARGTLARYHLWGEDPTNRIGDDVFRRVLRHGGRLVPYEVRWSGPVDGARITVRAPGADAAVGAAVAAEVRRLLGLDLDLTGFYRMAKADPALATLIEPLYGLRPTLAPTPFEMLVGSITAQQVNLSFAFACRARLVRRFGTPVKVGRETVWAFPEPARLAVARVRELRVLKYSTRKAEYIRDLARAVVSGTLDLDAVCAAESALVIERLTALRGLGRWTADWFLARCLGRGDVCPAGDLAVRKAFVHYYGRGRALSEDTIRPRARGASTRISRCTTSWPGCVCRVRRRGAAREEDQRPQDHWPAGSRSPQGRAPRRTVRARRRLGRRPRVHLSVRAPPARLRLRPVRRARGAADVGDDVAGGDQADRRRALRDVGRPAREPLSLSRAARTVSLRRLHRRPLMNEARKRWIFVGIMLSIFLAAIESTVVATAMPTVVASLGGIRIYSWVFSGFLLTQTVTMPLWGRFSDLYGRRPVYLAGLATFLAGSALSGASQNMVQLIVFRMVQGLGAGALMTLGYTIIGELFGLERRD